MTKDSIIQALVNPQKYLINISSSEINYSEFKLKNKYNIAYFDTFDLRLYKNNLLCFRLNNDFYILDKTKKRFSKPFKYKNTEDIETSIIVSPLIEDRKLINQFEYNLFVLLNKSYFVNLIPVENNLELPILNIIFEYDPIQFKENFSNLKVSKSNLSIIDFIITKYFKYNYDYTAKLNHKISKDKFSINDFMNHNISTLNSLIEVNYHGVRNNLDNEFLHDFRTSLRRFRVLLLNITKIDASINVDTENLIFKKVQKSTNKIRDYDVFIFKLHLLKKEVPSLILPYYELIFDDLQSKRESFFNKFSNNIDYLELNETINNFNNSLALQNINYEKFTELLSQIIKEYLDQIKHFYQILTNNFNVPDMHRLRIKIKVLRYLLEINQSVFRVKDYKRCEEQLKALQGKLGKYNDVEIQLSILNKLQSSFTKQKKHSDKLIALGYLYSYYSTELPRIKKDINNELFPSRLKALEKKVVKLIENI